MTIQYYIKHNYGSPFLYYKDIKAEGVAAIRQLTNNTTLTINSKSALEALGITFEQVLPN